MTGPRRPRPLTTTPSPPTRGLTGQLTDAKHPAGTAPVRSRPLPHRGGHTELLVRNHPDQVHVDATTHAVANRVAGSGVLGARGVRTNGSAQQRGWAALSQRSARGRAGWIPRPRRPTNPQARLDEEIPGRRRSCRSNRHSRPSRPPDGAATRGPAADRALDGAAYSQGGGGGGSGRRSTVDPALGPDLDQSADRDRDATRRRIDQR